MKKLLLLLACTLMNVAGMLAQNANRSGFFVELQGGTAFGQVLYYETYKGESSQMPRLKGGAVGSFDVGYRYASSTHFAFGAKAGVWSDFADFKTTQIRIMPGIRWTFNDFGSKNMSAFISFDTGVGLDLAIDADIPVFIPFELSAGLNFTQHFYGAIVCNYNVLASSYYGEELYCPHQVFINCSSYPSIALRLGYRF